MRRNEQKKDPSLAGTSEGRGTTKGLDRPDFVSFQATAHGAGAQPQLTGPAPGQSPAPDEGDRPGTGREQTKLEQDFLRALLTYWRAEDVVDTAIVDEGDFYTPLYWRVYSDIRTQAATQVRAGDGASKVNNVAVFARYSRETTGQPLDVLRHILIEVSTGNVFGPTSVEGFARALRTARIRRGLDTLALEAHTTARGNLDGLDALTKRLEGLQRLNATVTASRSHSN